MCVRNASSYDFLIKLMLENSLQEASTVFGWTGLSRLLMPCELKWRFCSPRSGKYCKNFWENRGTAETVKKPPQPVPLPISLVFFLFSYFSSKNDIRPG